MVVKTQVHGAEAGRQRQPWWTGRRLWPNGTRIKRHEATALAREDPGCDGLLRTKAHQGQPQRHVDRHKRMETGVQRLLSVANRQRLSSPGSQGQFAPLQQQAVPSAERRVDDQLETAERAIDKTAGTATLDRHIAQQGPGFECLTNRERGLAFLPMQQLRKAPPPDGVQRLRIERQTCGRKIGQDLLKIVTGRRGRAP